MSNVINNYAIIEHIGSITGEDYKTVYGTAYRRAAIRGLVNSESSKQVWTMKQACLNDSPYSSTVTDKMKYRIRFTKKPTYVFIVCDTIDNPYTVGTIDFIKSIWNDRNIPVEIITAQEGVIPEDEIKEYDFGDRAISHYRQCAIKWADALGWSFSAPLIREDVVRIADSWQKRRSIEQFGTKGCEWIKKDGRRIYHLAPRVPMSEIENIPGSKTSLISTNGDTFLDAFRTVASEEECKEFFYHYCYLRGYDRTDNDMLIESDREDIIEEMLECDYTICPECGAPVYKPAVSCKYCAERIEEEITEVYYDEDFHSGNKLDIYPDTDVTHADLATKAYRTYLAECKVRDSGNYYFPQPNIK